MILYPSYGTAKSGVGISAMAVLRPDLMMKSVVPVVMAGIIAVSFQGLSEMMVVFNYDIRRFMASSFRCLFLEIVCISRQIS